MLLLKNVGKNLGNSSVRCSFVEYFAVAFLVAQIINLVVYGFYPLLVKLALAGK